MIPINQYFLFYQKNPTLICAKMSAKCIHGEIKQVYDSGLLRLFGVTICHFSCFSVSKTDFILSFLLLTVYFSSLHAPRRGMGSRGSSRPCMGKAAAKGLIRELQKAV